MTSTSRGTPALNRRTALAVKTFMLGPRVDNVSACRGEQPDAYERWLEFLERNLLTYRLVEGAPRDPGFQISASSRSSNGFTVGRIATVEGRARLERTAGLIGRDGNDRYIVYTSLRGQFEISQFRHHSLCEESVSVLIDPAEPLLHAKRGNNDTLCFAMPRQFVEQRIAHPQSMRSRTLTVPSSALAHLAQKTMIALQMDALTLPESDFQAACRLVGDLVLLAFCGSGTLESCHRSVREATLANVKRVIRARLEEAELTLAEVARACHISLGYLHSVFRNEECTAWEFLKQERLQRARQLLESPACDTTVTDTALACGFSNMSQFSTAFRQAFGLRPRDVLRTRGSG